MSRMSRHGLRARRDIDLSPARHSHFPRYGRWWRDDDRPFVFLLRRAGTGLSARAERSDRGQQSEMAKRCVYGAEKLAQQTALFILQHARGRSILVAAAGRLLYLTPFFSRNESRWFLPNAPRHARHLAFCERAFGLGATLRATEA